MIFFRRSTGEFRDFFRWLNDNFRNFFLTTDWLISRYFISIDCEFCLFSCDRLGKLAGVFIRSVDEFCEFFLRPIDEFHDIFPWTVGQFSDFPPWLTGEARDFFSCDWWKNFAIFPAIGERISRFCSVTERGISQFFSHDRLTSSTILPRDLLTKFTNYIPYFLWSLSIFREVFISWDRKKQMIRKGASKIAVRATGLVKYLRRAAGRIK